MGAGERSRAGAVYRAVLRLESASSAAVTFRILHGNRYERFGAFGLRNGIAVSYTHLDVYKRQGKNGAGKSTLLHALLRRVTLEEGVAYFPQEVPDDEVRALLVELRALPTAERGRVLSIAARLESPPERVLDGEQLSPGEVRKLMIARSLLSSPRLIVMDEPTNHLDIRSIEALQDVLRHCACALVLVSHDEQFLDALVDERWVFEVEQEKGEVGLGDTHVRVVR